MSTFEVRAVRIDRVADHPGADRLTLNYIGGYVAISNKKEDGERRYNPGDLVVYVPEGAVVPDWVMQRYGYWDDAKNEGGLAGSQHNRVKSLRLRGIFSTGLILPLNTGDHIGIYVENGVEFHPVSEGDDLAELLGIVKYEPPIPAHMAGEITSIFGHTLDFDIENIKRWPNVIEQGDWVEFTEKVHGTFVCAGIVPGLNNPDLIDGDAFVTSKGIGKKGLVFKDNEANAGNLYMMVVRQIGLIEAMRKEFANDLAEGTPVYVLGEIYGQGVQDLQYGRKDKAFAGFDIYLGKPGEGRYLGPSERVASLGTMNIPGVNVLYVGPFSEGRVLELTDGSTVTGQGSHIREGVVIKPINERRHPELGRVVLKSVSEKYLLRKGEATEFE